MAYRLYLGSQASATSASANVATATGAAGGPSPSLAVNTAAASATGAAHNATVSVATSTNANAEIATATGAALGATTSIAASTAAATATGAALDATTTSLTALLVVANSGALTAGDTTLQSRLGGQGFSVTLRNDETAEPAPITQDIVVISESISATTLSTKYSTTTKGLLVFESASLDNYDMTSATATVTFNDDQVDSLDDTHPILVEAGVSGVSITISSPAIDQRYEESSTIAAAARSFLSQPGDATNVVGLTYDPGDTMQNAHVAEGRRAYIGIGYDTELADLNANGLAIVDAAFLWVAGQLAEPAGADAEVATATGAAYLASTSIAASANVATATGAALNAGISTTDDAPAGTATATGAALNATTSIGVNAGRGQATGLANNAGVSTTDEAPAATATATGTAYNATASTASSDEGPAERAAATAAANLPSITITTNGAIATATGAARAPAGSVAPGPTAGTATGTAYNATTTATGEAVSANAQAAAAIAAAYNATIATIQGGKGGRGMGGKGRRPPMRRRPMPAPVDDEEVLILLPFEGPF